MTKLAFAFLVALWRVWMAEWRIKGNGGGGEGRVGCLLGRSVARVNRKRCWLG